MSEAIFLRVTLAGSREAQGRLVQKITHHVGKCNELVRDAEHVIILAWRMVALQGEYSTCSVNPDSCDGVDTSSEELAGYSSSVNPIYFVPRTGRWARNEKALSGAPNGDATGDLWTTCRCYGPINSPCLPVPPTRSLSLWSHRLVFGCLFTHHPEANTWSKLAPLDPVKSNSLILSRN